jgi:DNA topoisomerase-2
MWKKFTHRQHVLERPDSYVGRVEKDLIRYWDPKPKTLLVSPALLKIFDEILVNASDEYLRDPKANKIDVTFSIETGEISIRNNKPIPVQKHDGAEDLWLPELIFGHLLTSSNFDDDAGARYTGGRNGYGAKLTNIYSGRFTVNIEDPVNKLTYNQIWIDNMETCQAPVIQTFTKKTGSTTVTFIPDYKRLGSPKFDLIEPVFRRRAIEIGTWVPKVTYNGESVGTNFEDFAMSHLEPDAPHAKMKQGNWEIIVAHSDDGFQQISFVNGISTSKGGTHVDHLVQELSKAIGSSPSQIKQHLFVFIKLLIDKPSFESQTKTELNTKIKEHLELKPKFIKDVLACGLGDDLKNLEKNRLKKSDGTKRDRIKGIPELDDANWAGGPKSDQCTLIITEGNSAKALAIAGLSVIGRDKYGVFPLRGKPKNVRDSSIKQLESNKEFAALKQILGLKQDTKDSSKLRYGRLMIMTDADLDGSHIKGLVLNMFHVFWPKLLISGYVCAMVTPVVKKGSQWFYTEEAFKASGSSSSGAKYYKGLGTSTSAEAREYFKMIDKLTVRFEADTQTDDSMALAFAKTHASDRKDWLRAYMAIENRPFVNYGSVRSLPVSEFIHKDLIKFSEADIFRSIPHLVDGLKPSQRKVLFAAKKKNLEKDMQVGQFAGYVGEHTDYHHGEASLHGTIIGLAQDFTGSNNINLFVPSGQFGSRLEGGKDHASVRYISTRLAPDTKKLFDPRDDPILTFSGTPEPDFFVPEIPIILVNGADGIGTGFSCSVPCFNPKDIKANIIRILDREPMVPMNPWYRGFTGRIEKKDDHTWTAYGTVKDGVVTELPPGLWTQDYKEHLDNLIDTGRIQKYENQSSDTKPHFTIHGGKIEVPQKDIRTSNMYLVTPNGIRKFESAEEILFEYTKVKLQFYKARKKHMKKVLEEKIKSLDEKKRFIDLVIKGTLLVFRRPKDELVAEMTGLGLPTTLLETRTLEYTEENVKSLGVYLDQIRTELGCLESTGVADMWKKDIDAL